MAKIRRKRQSRVDDAFETVNPHAAGIDVGSRFHVVAVPPGSSPDGADVQTFDTFTDDLKRLVVWLQECGVDTVAMESTGVYWIPTYELLEDCGFEVCLCDTRQLKSVPGRKTDVIDARWLQRLHTAGLLRPAFRPDSVICELRAYVRQRSMLISESSKHIQHIQKALEQMNIKLREVLREVTGKTSMLIIDAILAGERDPHKLASLRQAGCKNNEATIAKALHGNWRTEHLFALRQAVELWRYYGTKIAECDVEIEKLLGMLPDQTDGEPLAGTGKGSSRRRNDLHFDGRTALYRMTGVDLTAIEGIDELTALKVLSEIGTDMGKWSSASRFASWLGLCPGNNITGGRRRSGRNRRNTNPAAQALRLAAQTLTRSKSALGAFLRRKAAHRGMKIAIKATAHKLAKLVYSMLKYGTEYVSRSQEQYEKQYHERRIANLKRNAKELGFTLTEVAS